MTIQKSPGALGLDLLKALGVVDKQVISMTLHISGREMPLLIVRRVIDSEDMQALKEVAERYRLTAVFEGQP